MLARFLKYFVLALIALYLASCGDEENEPTPEPEEVDCTSLDIEIVSIMDAECGSTGVVEVSAIGGEGPYQFALIGGQFTSETTYTNLMPGNYAAIVEDANDCSASVDFTIEGVPNDLQISVTVTNPAGCGTSDGEIEVTLDNGAGAIEYSVNEGDFSSEMVYTGLSANMYEITARNDDGCETTAVAQVLSGITLNDHIEPIISTNCALPTCHGGSIFPDFSQKSNILSRATSISSQTASGSMPPSGALDQELIDQIACWVEDGALDN